MNDPCLAVILLGNVMFKLSFWFTDVKCCHSAFCNVFHLVSNWSWDDGRKCTYWFKMGCTQFHILSLVLFHRPYVSPFIILFIASVFIFSYCTCHPPLSVYHFLASEGVFCLAFCLQSPQLNNNLYHHELGFYFAKELIFRIMCGGVETRGHKVPCKVHTLRARHTVTKNSCLKIGLLI